jgi:hypothetical protein
MELPRSTLNCDRPMAPSGAHRRAKSEDIQSPQDIVIQMAADANSESLYAIAIGILMQPR